MPVTTRSTSLASIPHSSFALRFSDLSEIEAACREGEDQRALRMLDWIGARVNRHCVKWVQDVENSPEKDSLRAPWWDDLRRCAEGEHIPSKTEGWNHPMAIILAVSTTAPNPLQAITALHSKALDFPLWVDTTLFRYTLIIHPRNSPLSDEEAGALFNAVKKQYGLHSYLLPLDLPSPTPPPVPVPFLLPRLPLASAEPSSNDPSCSTNVNTLRLSEGDIQQTGKFTREFVVMSLVPWMEKCVLEWNENFSSTRRLPSRLFSSTRRLFGSPSPSPAPTHHTSSSISSLPPKSSYSPSMGANISPPSQQRRLAEFATILGDYKLAVTVWEALRKDDKGGADILPILLSPSPAISIYVSNALSSIHSTTSELPPKAQLRALLHAVRWETGIPISDFLGDILGGERWLVWAAGDAEELPSALLLAHAAQFCVKKSSKRRAALLFLVAANKLEKLGIKPLTIHFLRMAHELYLVKPVKLLSPSFWESEYQLSSEITDFDSIQAGIEHPLGRLLYTTGDIINAVKLFVGLLRGSTIPYSSLPINSRTITDAQQLVPDKLFLEDFRIAFGHFKSTVNDKFLIGQLQLPIKICRPRYTRVRVSGDFSQQDDSMWQRKEEVWQSFRRNYGEKEGLEKSDKAMVGETFWIDIVLQNPLDTEINLSKFSVNVREDEETTVPQSVGTADVIEVTLAAKERKMVSIPIKPLRPGTLVISHVSYDFLSLLPSSEPLSYRGRRLHTTSAQKQGPIYGPDVVFKVTVVEAEYRLKGSFREDDGILLQGEYRDMQILLSNTGVRPISEIWIIMDSEDELWPGESQDDYRGDASETEVLHSTNSLSPDVVHRIPEVASEESPLQPGDSKQVTIKLRAEGSGRKEISLLMTYREGSCKTFQSVRLCKEYEVQTLFELAAIARPCDSMEHTYTLDLEISNNHPSNVIEVAQVTTLSPTWGCTIMRQETIVLHPSQSSHILVGASPWSGINGVQETLEFVSAAFGDILGGRDAQQRTLPSIDLLCSHVHKGRDPISIQSPVIRHFIQHRRKQIVSQNISQSFPHVPSRLHSSIFPLYNPFTIDILVFWTVPSKDRFGYILLPDLSLGARHGAMREFIENAENAKTGRSMYAETEREKLEILDSLRNSEWNAEMDPLCVTVEDQGGIIHNFTKGPRIVPVMLTLRNYSLTHTIKYALKFPMVQKHLSNLVPTYTGRTTFRGTLKPSQSTVVKPKLWLAQPGTYVVDEWDLTTEVFQSVETEEVPLRRYNRRPSPQEIISLTISDVPGA
ncbi:hypothetical protein AX15_000933 [Amanita polypyramis BW_CC]|nr:hypothetical protein AX15_000933 [Amanita polypyramis BW_CC]